MGQLETEMLVNPTDFQGETQTSMELGQALDYI